MASRTTVGVVGASARAAVHSLIRAGFDAWAVDLFGDRDLRAVAPCVVCPIEDYPAALPRLAEQFPPGPVMYTGGLENHPQVVAELASKRELWGTPPGTLETVRDPFCISRALEPRGMNLGYPLVLPADSPPKQADLYPEIRFLLKPRSGASGHGIRFWNLGDPLPVKPERWYLQEFIDGVSMSALFYTDERRTLLLGVTEQLIGIPWLYAAPFGYAGNIGPVDLNTTFRYILHRSGETIAAASGLRGIWGFDFIYDVDVGTYPVEVNPRYTASVEVLEHGNSQTILGYGWRTQTSEEMSRTPSLALRVRQEDPGTVGKAIYFAPHDFTFPVSGPWDADLATSFDPWRLPGFADIPAANSPQLAGHPVITMFASGSSAAECREQLQSRARELDQLFAEAMW